MESVDTAREDFALIVQGESKAAHTLGKFVKLLVSYKYGLIAREIDNFNKVRSVLRSGADKMRCVFVIQGKLSAKSTVLALSANGQIPLFLMLPGSIAAEQSEKCEEITSVHVCPWELAFATGQGSLQQIIGSALPLNGDPFAAEQETAEAEELARDRLDKIDTFPTLPKIVTNIMQLISDPRTTIATARIVILGSGRCVKRI